MFYSANIIWLHKQQEKDSRIIQFPSDTLFRIESFWLLAACVLFPHENAEPERGFSINKSNLSIHGYFTKNETIVALRLVKDFIIERGGVEEIKVSKEMLRFCDRARERYSIFLEQQKKMEEPMKLARNQKMIYWKWKMR